MCLKKNDMNYTDNPHTIFGMMSKKDTILDSSDLPFHIVRKNKSKLVLFPKKEQVVSLDDLKKLKLLYPEYKNIAVHYLTESNYLELKKELKGIPFNKFKSTLICSHLSSDFFGMRGKNNTEFRETLNKLNKQLTVKVNEPLQDILHPINTLLSLWDDTSGQKYGWQRHSGYDRTFFASLYQKEVLLDNNLTCLTFYDKDVLIGYSVYSNETTNCMSYIIRKFASPRKIRNLGLYIDTKTFIHANETLNLNNNFIVNWGASSGSVLDYKRKFPGNLEKTAWFISLNSDNI